MFAAPGDYADFPVPATLNFQVPLAAMTTINSLTSCPMLDFYLANTTSAAFPPTSYVGTIPAKLF
jgi:hypothetical protein